MGSMGITRSFTRGIGLEFYPRKMGLCGNFSCKCDCILFGGVGEERFFGPSGVYLDLMFALLIVFNNLFGLVLDFYHTVLGWDIATHYTTSLFLGVSALVLLERGFPQMLKQVPKPAVIFGVLMFSLGLGALWEIGEFASDILRGTDFQHGLINTMQDLIVDMVAGIVVGVAWVLKRR